LCSTHWNTDTWYRGLFFWSANFPDWRTFSFSLWFKIPNHKILVIAKILCELATFAMEWAPFSQLNLPFKSKQHKLVICNQERHVAIITTAFKFNLPLNSHHTFSQYIYVFNFCLKMESGFSKQLFSIS